MSRPALLAVLVSIAIGSSVHASAGLRSEDRVAVLEVDRKVVAVAGDSTLAEFELSPDEKVVSVHARGTLGLALTTRRLLGIHAGAGNWLEVRYRVGESDPPQIRLGDRVALAAFPHRVLALSSAGPSWHELDLGPGENPARLVAGANLGAIVTSRRVLGFSAGGSRFVQEPITPREDIERERVGDAMIALFTRRRVLVYQVGATRWTWTRRRPD